MKKVKIVIILFLITKGVVYSQNNIFPNNGSVGIGTLSPRTKTEFNSGLPVTIPIYDNKTNGIAVTDGGHIYGRIGVANLASGGNGYPTYLQAGDWSGHIYYNILINPLGGNVGIGTTSPQAKLHVSGSIISGVKDYSYNAPVFQLTNQSNVDGISGMSPTGAFRWYTNPNNSYKDGFLYQLRSFDAVSGESSGLITITGDGKMGIGVSNPLDKLDVYGKFVVNHDGIIDWGGYRSYGRMTWDNGRAIIGGQTNMALVLTSNNSERVRVDVNGNVLIGKTIQSQTELKFKLDVAGPIRADEIVVNTTGADFVFEPTYKLRTLSELETFIRTNKHLPDIAPAKEMQENGVSAGEMQAKLLQKQEETVLYLIEMAKQIEILKKENEQLKAEKDQQLASQQKTLDKLVQEIENLKTKINQ